MRCKKTDKSPIWKPKIQVWREHGLQRAANSPEVCHFKPALTPRPHGHYYDHHAPVAHLHWQHMLPIDDATAADENQIDDIVQDQYRREDTDNHLLQRLRFRAPYNRGKRKRQDDREENNREMRQTVGVEVRLHALF